MNDAQMKALLQNSKVIAVVGLSPKQERDSYRVAAYLQKAGYRIIPVRPACAEILGEKCYPSITAIPAAITVDIVNVFRRSEETPPVVEEAAKRPNLQAVWLQLGIANQEAQSIAKQAGLQFVQNLCIKVEHARLLP